ncbi:thiamine phosphate synthase [Aquibacillus sp. 3ASR75-11]|uniref:Thiamine-phosphate synthase n=1 Tax=Terrihalobacillus insolitus TaxID=2950438 RepID=A0A9X3WQ34_9BACI|nr:thiamine phosphate synthase [Terrihalobacillus insolitus]MDC3412696.1 thiamine phosphate synthase [Terrihalobacillus insolitus]MDC3423827.1 thiamine phosphate synthase [Terrihalobacillus insolitus]
MSEFDSKRIEELLTLYFIMGSTNCDRDPVYVLEQAIEGGITLFQYREKGRGALEGKQKVKLAEKLQKICKDASIPFIVNDDVDLALTIDADGVHVGQEDECARAVRERIGNKILGISTHTLSEAHHAIADGADYLGLGPIYPTQSKEDTEKVQGTELIQNFRELNITTPIVGIGGITSSNANKVIQAGGNGVSVISAIAAAENVKQATEQLKKQVDKNVV